MRVAVLVLVTVFMRVVAAGMRMTHDAKDARKPCCGISATAGYGHLRAGRGHRWQRRGAVTSTSAPIVAAAGLATSRTSVCWRDRSSAHLPFLAAGEL
jgi:hypothetical protein